jgi:exonuclease SbcD
MVKVLHVSDIHLGSGLAYGKINPATGFNTRLEDFARSLERCINYALGIEQGTLFTGPVDLVLFGGDAFPDATPPPLHQDLFAQQFRRLADAGIPTVLLVGNHDQQGQGQEGSSLAIYRTLGVKGFIVGDTLSTHCLETAGGSIQVTTLPWLNRSVLLSRQETLGLSAEMIGQQILQRLQVILEAEIRALDPTIPAILLVHAMIDSAKQGAERHLAVGKGFTIPLGLLTRSNYHYVALGHVHRHQVLCQDPLIIYPGSLERVDFGEEYEEKGFILADVTLTGTRYEFISLPVRAFRTIRVDISHLPLSEPSLQDPILEAIASTAIQDAIVRLIYRLRTDQMNQFNEQLLHKALASAFSYSITPEVIAEHRIRLPGLSPSEPLQALQQYLDTREDLAGLQTDMLNAAQSLLADREAVILLQEEELTTPEDPQVEQLQLL